ncbi:unnamed protein product, partial [Prorocentrum cordatum]
CSLMLSVWGICKRICLQPLWRNASGASLGTRLMGAVVRDARTALSAVGTAGEGAFLWRRPAEGPGARGRAASAGPRLLEPVLGATAALPLAGAFGAAPRSARQRLPSAEAGASVPPSAAAVAWGEEILGGDGPSGIVSQGETAPSSDCL